MVEGAVGSGAEPEIPIEAFGDGWAVRWARETGGIERMVDPEVHFADGSDDAGEEDFGDGAGAFGGAALDAHLGGGFGAAGFGGDEARFVDGVSEWLGGVDVLAGSEGAKSDGSVGVVGRGDDDGVDILFFFIEHFAKIAVNARAGVFAEDGGGEWVIDVAKGGECFAGTTFHVAAAHASHADGGNAEGVAGGLVTGAAEDVAGDEHGGESRGGGSAAGNCGFGVHVGHSIALRGLFGE